MGDGVQGIALGRAERPEPHVRRNPTDVHHLALVDVSDPCCDALIEQHVHHRGRVVSVDGETGTDLGEVEDGIGEVRSEVIDGTLPASPDEGGDGRCSEARGRTTIDGDEHPEPWAELRELRPIRCHQPP